MGSFWYILLVLAVGIIVGFSLAVLLVANSDRQDGREKWWDSDKIKRKDDFY